MRDNKLDERTLWFVTDDDLRTTPSQLYHESTKIGRARLGFPGPSAAAEKQLTELHRKVAGSGKRYDYAPTTPLAASCTTAIDVALRARRSRRQFGASAHTVALATLADVLVHAAGETGAQAFPDGSPLPLRAYPSAGGLYPLEIYPLLLRVDGLRPGIFHLDVHRSCLAFLGELERAPLRAAFLDEPMVDGAAAIVLVTAVLPRSRLKYGERAYRYAHLEAGHLAQNLLLAAEARGLAAAPVGGFVERELEDLLDVDGFEEIVVYSVFLGVRP